MLYDEQLMRSNGRKINLQVFTLRVEVTLEVIDVYRQWNVHKY